MNRDFLIVGQGLAGSVVALTLLNKGYEIHVINNFEPHSSSMVAAGIFNPVTGKQMKKTWNADRLFPKLHDFYRHAELVMGKSFFHPMEIYRPFLSVQEQNDWMAKSSEEGYGNYIKKVSGHSLFKSYVYDEYGGILLKGSGYLDVVNFLGATKAFLETKRVYENAVYDESELIINEDSISYKDITAKKIIYCNGNDASNSKYFGWLPFRPVKGEILLLKNHIPLNKIFNRGVFVVPVESGLCKVGATYDWRNLNTAPSDDARKELLDKLNKLSPLSFEIKDQIAGIRPATKDRKPFIGIHPRYKPLCIFNGLGTKGVSLAPYYAEEFLNFLERNEELHPEVNIIRYF